MCVLPIFYCCDCTTSDWTIVTHSRWVILPPHVWCCLYRSELHFLWDKPPSCQLRILSIPSDMYALQKQIITPFTASPINVTIIFYPILYHVDIIICELLCYSTTSLHLPCYCIITAIALPSLLVLYLLAGTAIRLGLPLSSHIGFSLCFFIFSNLGSKVTITVFLTTNTVWLVD